MLPIGKTKTQMKQEEQGGSVVECLNRDRGIAGSKIVSMIKGLRVRK